MPLTHYQHTLSQPLKFEGIGLHSGQNVVLNLMPANINTGLVIKRVDLPQQPTLKLTADVVKEAIMCTAVIAEHFKVMTIEHLISAFAAAQIDNCLIELNADEIPVLDGSAYPFFEAIQSVGTTQQNATRSYLKIMQPVTVEQDDRSVSLLPIDDPCFEIDIEGIALSHPVIDNSNLKLNYVLDESTYAALIAPARTFGRVNDVEKLHAANLVLGASLDNAVGLTDDAVLNAEGLRFEDEFIRHKLLDTIGDLYLAGPIIGKFVGHMPGHALNNAILRKVLDNTDNYKWITYPHT